MASFIQIGRHWINVEQVIRVDLKEDSSRPGMVISADVLFSSGQKDQFGGQEAHAIADYLHKHKQT